MVTIEAGKKYYKELNEEIRQLDDKKIVITGAVGQRYIGTGLKNRELTIYGTPGNAMGAYLTDTDITVYGNVQDAVGDTMDSGRIIVHGNCGDTLGYGMRGGSIYIRGNGGYRVGIHMKEYMEHHPVIVIGGQVGSFLGEYQAGGTLIVLGIGCDGRFPAGNYCGTGMHGGTMFIRSDVPPEHLPPQVKAEKCSRNDLEKAMDYIRNYCRYFDMDLEDILKKSFYKLTPSAGNPYNNLYAEYIN